MCHMYTRPRLCSTPPLNTCMQAPPCADWGVAAPHQPRCSHAPACPQKHSRHHTRQPRPSPSSRPVWYICSLCTCMLLCTHFWPGVFVGVGGGEWRNHQTGCIAATIVPLPPHTCHRALTSGGPRGHAVAVDSPSPLPKRPAHHGSSPAGKVPAFARRNNGGGVASSASGELSGRHAPVPGVHWGVALARPVLASAVATAVAAAAILPILTPVGPASRPVSLVTPAPAKSSEAVQMQAKAKPIPIEAAAAAAAKIAALPPDAGIRPIIGVGSNAAAPGDPARSAHDGVTSNTPPQPSSPDSPVTRKRNVHRSILVSHNTARSLDITNRDSPSILCGTCL